MPHCTSAFTAQSAFYFNCLGGNAAGQVWQFSCGQIKHTGWRQMTAPLDTSLGWPVQRISGGGATFPYPLQLQMLVLDYPTDDAATRRAVYLDDLATAE